MWPLWILLMALAVAGTSWFWKRRCDRLHSQLARSRAEMSALQTEQQQTQGEAQARELALFNSMVEGVLVLDARNRIRLSNQALDRLFGVQHDIRGQTLLEAFRLDSLQQLAQQVLSQGQVLHGEIDLPGSERRWLQVNATPLIDRQRQPQGMILVCHDLTRIRQLENTRREFVANVSHELRTPLSMIKGYAETLLHGAAADPAVATRFLQTIEKHADRLTYLIEDLLTISRLESGQIVMNIQEVDLQTVVDEVLTDLELRAQERAVTLDNQVLPDLTVKADADRLQQVFFNLVDNAIKYGRQAGCVAIEAAPIDADTVRVQVRDDGPGIPPEALDRIFERFYRLDKSRSREPGGTGLGLAIVKHIIQFHGGEVWAESQPGRGATFSFTLPMAGSVSNDRSERTPVP
jgi:two-component system, OmpR family, phosphate regulon sensor histidine kinase PhoR